MVQVICRDTEQVVGDYVVDGLKLTRWDAADEAENRDSERSRETVALCQAY